MIKRSPIKRQWQVVPICDKCESIMTRDETKTEIINHTEILYTYVCPCGEIFKSEVSYPHTQIKLNLRKSEVID